MNRLWGLFGLLIGAGLVASALSCTSVKKDLRNVARVLGIVEDIGDRPLPQAPPEYKEALADLAESKYADALAKLNDFIIQEPTSAYVQAAAFNSGRALEGLGRWSEAVERYRSVVVACEGVAPKLQAMALYRLTFCYEALADDQQTVAAMSDLERRVGALPPQIARAELPARFAAAYARIGNFDKAIEYYKKAEGGIAQLKRSAAPAAAQVPEWLPKTLYFMGSLSLRRVSWNDFEMAFRPLARSQTYLLECAELGVEPWAGRAAKDLQATYGDLWRTIEMAPTPDDSDPQAAAREIQSKQFDRAALVLDSLAELKARFMVGDALPGPAAGDIRKFVADMEKKAKEFLERRPVGDGLTSEAEKRRSLPRGKVIAPDGSLEKKFLESSRKKDPNL